MPSKFRNSRSVRLARDEKFGRTCSLRLHELKYVRRQPPLSIFPEFINAIDDDNEPTIFVGGCQLFKKRLESFKASLKPSVVPCRSYHNAQQFVGTNNGLVYDASHQDHCTAQILYVGIAVEPADHRSRLIVQR